MSDNKSPIRVAQVIGKLNAGGVESVIYNYYRNICHEKCQFDFYVDSDSNYSFPKDLIDMGAQCIVIPPYQKLPQYILALKKHFKESQYPIVHINMNTLSVFGLFAAWMAGIPVRINHNHSTASKGETKKNILKYILRPCAKVFATDYCACSKYAGEWLFGRRSMEKGEVTVFNNAIDLERFKYNPEKRSEMRKSLGLEGKFVVGHVGRFCYQKNHDFLIDVFQEVHKRRPSSVLLLVGIGELTSEVKAKVRSKGLEDSVVFLGARDDVNELYQAMDVFVLPSRYEGLGMVAIEAQAAGLPTICSDAVPQEAKVSGCTCFLPLCNSEEWAEKVVLFNGGRRRDTSDEVRAAGYDISIEAKKLEEYYEKKWSS